MGDVVDLTTVRRPPSLRRAGRTDRLGDILLFTGVRIERRLDEAEEDPAASAEAVARTPPRRCGD